MASQETRADFARRNGGNPVRVGHRVLLPTGASYDPWQWYAPSADLWERTKQRLAYAQARLDVARQSLAALESSQRIGGVSWTWDTFNLGPPPDTSDVEWGHLAPTLSVQQIMAEQQKRSGEVALKLLRGIVSERETALAQMEAEYEALPQSEKNRGVVSHLGGMRL